MAPIPTVRVFLAGDSGSGKSTRAHQMYLAKMPRIIVLDTLGEWAEFQLPNGHTARADAIVVGVSDLVDAVRARASRGRFFLSVYLDGDGEFEELIDWLVPLGDKSQSPALIMGGCGLLVDEVDVYARNQGAPPKEIRTLYRRSRHVGLSVFSATQRPGNVSKEVTAQSTHIIAHRLHEPADRDYITNVMRWSREEESQWMEWVRRHPHGAMWKEMSTGHQLQLPESGPPRVVRPPQTHLPFPDRREEQAAMTLDDAADVAEESEEP